jgi:hypothetical protein
MSNVWGERDRVKRRTEIMIEIDEVTFVSRYQSSGQEWCSGCSALVPMLTPQQASAIAGVSVRTINRLIEAGGVHFIETPDRLLLVCLNSLH